MENERKKGFGPVFDENSKILILGSFPSVKSREVQFYYGNKQNRFWKTLFEFYKEKAGTTEEIILFLKRHKIALWDMVTECEIDGSKDSTVKNYQTADLDIIFQKAKIEKILLNGSLSYNLFIEKYKDIDIKYVKMQSTSPANPRFDKILWEKELNDIR